MEIIKFIEYIVFTLLKSNRKTNTDILFIIEELRDNNDISEDLFKSIRRKILDNMNNNERDLKENLDKIKELV